MAKKLISLNDVPTHALNQVSAYFCNQNKWASLKPKGRSKCLLILAVWAHYHNFLLRSCPYENKPNTTFNKRSTSHHRKKYIENISWKYVRKVMRKKKIWKKIIFIWCITSAKLVCFKKEQINLGRVISYLLDMGLYGSYVNEV